MPLHTESDVVLTATALMVSLVPGSLVVEVHRPSHTLYLHALLASAGRRTSSRCGRTVWGQERRILAAFGVDTLEMLQAEGAAT